MSKSTRNPKLFKIFADSSMANHFLKVFELDLKSTATSNILPFKTRTNLPVEILHTDNGDL